jgi:hypothetical protein
MVYGLWFMVKDAHQVVQDQRQGVKEESVLESVLCTPNPNPTHIKEIRIWELYPKKLDDDREYCRGFDHAHLLDLDGVTVLVQTGGLLLHLQ